MSYDNDRKATLMLITIPMVFILVLGWSIWAWTNFPLKYAGGAEMMKRCDATNEKSEYCVGFSEGYNYAEFQCNLDDELERTLNPDKLLNHDNIK